MDIFTTNMTVDEYERLSHLKLENSDVHAELDVEPGEVIVGDKDIVINENRSLTTITVTSLCDRPIQVGSHFPFTEANKYLQFDRGAAYGKRLVRHRFCTEHFFSAYDAIFHVCDNLIAVLVTYRILQQERL